MDLCQLKQAERPKHLQKYKGRVALWEENVTDNDGYKAVCTEQGASRRQQNVWIHTFQTSWSDRRNQRRGISAYTQVNLAESHRLMRLPETECPHIWIRFPPSRRPKNLNAIVEPVVPLERNQYGHPWAGLLFRMKTGSSSCETHLGKCTNFGMSFASIGHHNYSCACK